MSTALTVAEIEAHAKLAALRERRQAVGRVLSGAVKTSVWAATVRREQPGRAKHAAALESSSRSMIRQCSEALVRTSEEVTAAAERMQSGPLRARAQQVRVGEAVAPVSRQPDAKPGPQITIPEALIVLRHPVTYRAAHSSIVLIREGGCSTPAPVAAAAMDQGIGFAPGTPAARTAVKEIELGKGGRAVDSRGRLDVSPAASARSVQAPEPASR
jgi:hypothetical protein